MLRAHLLWERYRGSWHYGANCRESCDAIPYRAPPSLFVNDSFFKARIGGGNDADNAKMQRRRETWRDTLGKSRDASILASDSIYRSRRAFPRVIKIATLSRRDRKRERRILNEMHRAEVALVLETIEWGRERERAILLKYSHRSIHLTVISSVFTSL